MGQINTIPQKFLAKTVFDEKNNVGQFAKKKLDETNNVDLITKKVINKKAKKEEFFFLL